MIRTLVELLNENDSMLALAIHNGHRMHPALEKTCGIDEEDRLREEDPYTGLFAEEFQNRIIVHTSRFSVDLNRNPEKAVYLKPEDCWGLPVRTKPVSEELLTRLRSDYTLWYETLAYAIRRLLDKHPFLLVLDLHSYNHRRGGKDAPADAQTDNPDIILGRNNMPEEYYHSVEKLRSMLDGHKVCGKALDCRTDVKFTGGWLSRWLHKTFPGRLMSLSVEFKKIFMDEWSGIVNEEFRKILSSSFYQAVAECRQNLPQTASGRDCRQ